MRYRRDTSVTVNVQKEKENSEQIQKCTAPTFPQRFRSFKKRSRKIQTSCLDEVTVKNKCNNRCMKDELQPHAKQ